MSGHETSRWVRWMPAVFAAVVVMVMAMPSPATAADAAAPETAAPAGSDEQPDTTGELFPGVKGISGAELARRIQEYEQRKRDQEKRRPTSTSNTGTTRSTPDTKETREPTPASQPAKQPAREAEPAAKPAVETRTMGDLAGLSDQVRDYLRELDRRTTRIEMLAEKGDEIRKDAESQASKQPNEDRIQYYLQWTDARSRDTRAYEELLVFPIVVYRYTFEQGQHTIRWSKDNRPADMPPPAVAAEARILDRVNAVRRHCLLASAELFTRMRHLDAAEMLYGALAREWGDDKAIKASYAACEKVRDTPKPAGPPVDRQTKYEQAVLDKDPVTGETNPTDYSKWRR